MDYLTALALTSFGLVAWKGRSLPLVFLRFTGAILCVIAEEIARHPYHADIVALEKAGYVKDPSYNRTTYRKGNVLFYINDNHETYSGWHVCVVGSCLDVHVAKDAPAQNIQWCIDLLTTYLRGRLAAEEQSFQAMRAGVTAALDAVFGDSMDELAAQIRENLKYKSAYQMTGSPMILYDLSRRMEDVQFAADTANESEVFTFFVARTVEDLIAYRESIGRG